MKTRPLFYLFFIVTVVIILMSSFSSSTSYSTADADSISETPFPVEYERWVLVDSIPEVQFPEGYRSWTHVKSKVNRPSGYHHIYANDLAIEGYRTGKFPEGSVIVADFLEMIESEKSIDEGKRRYVDVMVKDSRQYANTGGWGFEEFEGSSKSIRRTTQAKAHAACYTCHTKRTENDFVFSEFRE